MSIPSPSELLDIMEQTSPSARVMRLGTVLSGSPSAGYKVRFDSDLEVGAAKSYMAITAVLVGDRVVIAPVGRGYVILGAIGYDSATDPYALPTRLGALTKTVGDLNDVVETGFYSPNNSANSPLGSNVRGYLTVIAFSSTYIFQRIETVSGAANPLTWTRQRVAAGWTAWSRLHTPPATGTVMITPSSANANTSANVTFPAGRFASAPMVVVSVATGYPNVVFASASSVTSTGFTAYLNRPDTTATAVQWFATDQ